MKKYSKLLGLLGFGMIFILSGCSSKTTLELMDYVEVKFEGVDTKGKAVLDVDWSTMENDIMKNSKNSKDNKLEDELEKVVSLFESESSINYKLNKTDNLTNGDSVTLTISYDKDLEEKYDFKFTGAMKKDFTVEGLKDVEEINAFDKKYFNVKEGKGIYIEFIGVSPEAEIQIRNTLPKDNILSKVEYSVKEPYESYSNGDKIEIIATIPQELQDEGYILKEESTSINVDGVAKYISSLDEIDDETWNKIKKQADDLFSSKVKNSNIDDCAILRADKNYHMTYAESVDNFKYDKCHFLSLKEGLKGNYYNILYIGYSVDVKNIHSYFDTTLQSFNDTYGFFAIHDLVIYPTGEINFSIDMLEIGDLYVNKDSFKNEYINSNIGEYNYTEGNIQF